MRDYVKCHLNDGGEKIMLRCDVCEGLVDLDDTICKKCGFDNHIIPDDASPEIQEIERKRIEAAKKVAEAIKQLEDRLDEANHNLQTKQSELETANQHLQTKQSELDAANQQLQTKQSKLDAANQQLQTKQSELKAANEQLQAKQLELNFANNEWQKVKEANQKLQTANDELKKTKQELNLLKGFVMLEDIRNDIRTILPIYEGINTYGTNPKSDTHHEIKFSIRGYKFYSIHFTIETSAKGMKFSVNSNVNALQNGGYLQGKTIYARQCDNFILDDKLRINISSMD